MNNIEKALEAHERPWTKYFDEVWIIKDAQNKAFCECETEEQADIIVAAVNAYEPEKKCEACGGAKVIPVFNPRHHDNTDYVKCRHCTGKQPDLLDVDNEAIHLLGLEIVKRDKAIRELMESQKFLMGIYRKYLSMTSSGYYINELLEKHEAALAKAKEVVK